MRSDQQGQPDHGGLVDTNGKRAARVKGLSEEQKKTIRAMSQPSDMDNKERKRQMAAMDRYVNSNKATLPPVVLEKFMDCYGNGQKKFEPVSTCGVWESARVHSREKLAKNWGAKPIRRSGSNAPWRTPIL